MKSIVLFSGGLDSTVLLYRQMRDYPGEVGAISFNYGQRHRKELEVGARLLQVLEVPQERVVIHSDMRLSSPTHTSLTPLFGGSSQTDESIPVPEGHYEDESMRLTFVPNRNMVMLSIASAWAIANKANHIAIAAHAGDHAIYPDCRGEFLEDFSHAVKSGNYHKIHVLSPFLSFSKAEIVKLGRELGVPLDLTWSCYKGGKHHCGRCGTCVERREAFRVAEVEDWTVYEGE